jgi:hypothetical protein
VGEEGRLKAGSRSTPCTAGPGGGGAVSQKGRPAKREATERGEGGRSRRQKRRNDRGDREQRALYTRVKRRGAPTPIRRG